MIHPQSIKLLDKLISFFITISINKILILSKKQSYKKYFSFIYLIDGITILGINFLSIVLNIITNSTIFFHIFISLILDGMLNIILGYIILMNK